MNIIQKLLVKPFAIVGHRGAKGECAENTLPCIEHALKVGVDVVEIDVRETADGELILLHDPTFERVAGVNLSPKELTLKEIKERIRIEGKYEVPTLREVLEVVGNRAGLFAEIKEPQTTDKVVQEVLKYGNPNLTAFISFYEEALKRIKEIDEELKTGFIYAKPQGAITKAKELRAEIILPKWMLATPKAVAFAHRLKLKVVAWVVNDGRTLERVLTAKVDAVATDKPSWLVEVREKLKGLTF